MAEFEPKTMYHLRGLGKCLKFLISKDSFFKRILYRIFTKLIYYSNIIFLYTIEKVIRNISINILGRGKGYEMKMAL